MSDLLKEAAEILRGHAGGFGKLFKGQRSGIAVFNQFENLLDLKNLFMNLGFLILLRPIITVFKDQAEDLIQTAQCDEDRSVSPGFDAVKQVPDTPVQR